MSNAVTAMVAALVHRGPDFSDTRDFAGCSLGHNRLRIIDLSPAGDQPMPNEDHTIWVVFNGELYNFIELRRELTAAGHRFRSRTDTEVIVHLYEELGDRLAERLRGMFAFAIWDQRTQRLLLCRDRLGIKPLYYRTGQVRIDFASEVQALARPTDSLDLDAVGTFLRLGWVTGPSTILAGIAELPAAHTLVWESGRIRIQSYWTPPFTSSGRSAPTTEELSEVLTDAVRRHLVADVPVGVFLSSGVDSAVVTALAKRISPDIHAYTIAFEDGADESVGAAAIARRLGVHHTAVAISGKDMVRSLPQVIASMDQPSVDGVNSWVISRAVREAGLVVALSGVGGDELFAGYSTFQHVPRLVRTGNALRMAPSWARTTPTDVTGSLQRTAHTRSQRALEAIGTGGWENAYESVRGLFGQKELATIWSPALSGGYPTSVRIPWSTNLNGPSMVGQLELANYLPYQLLRDSDCMSMAHALELRTPLLDDHVVELAIAGQCSLGRQWSKAHLLSAVDPGLNFLAHRPKKTFTLPLDHWMQGPLREQVLGAFIHLGEADLGFNRRKLTDLWRGYHRGWVGWRPIWALAVLGMWLDAHSGEHLSHAPRRHT